MRYYALWLSLLCIFVFILQLAVPGFTDLLLLNKQAFPEIWRFLTAIFLHGSLPHLLYNLFALALFGSMLEKLIGSRRFLLVFLITGILANIISINFYDSALGASGAIFGVIGALIVLRPGMLVFAFWLPMPLIIAGVLWALGDVIGIFVPSGTANIAHLSGLFFGLLFGAWYKKSVASYFEESRRERIVIDENSMRRWEDEHL